ncbi:hypothetical protein PISMIDRAFT_99152, partial [Pisolithus microcarpus 441]
GLQFLFKKEILPAGAKITIERLSTALFLIAQLPNVPVSAINRIQAVAFFLEKVGTTALTSEIQNTLHTLLSEMITNHVIASISPMPAATLPMEDMLQHVKSICSTVNALQEKTPLLEAIHKHVVGDFLASPLTLLHLSLHCTHSNTAKSPPSSKLAMAALAKAETQTRQVLFTPAPDQMLYSQMTDLGSITLDIMDLTLTFQNKESPHINVKSAVCLSNGNLLVELTSAEVANWLRSKGMRKILSNSLGTDTVVKEHSYPLVVPFFPISLNLTDLLLLYNIKNDNELPPNSLHSIQWVKNPEHCKPGQQVAHTLLLVKQADTANALLRDGIYILRSKLFPKKDRKEPVHYAKCQLWGHIAHGCKTILDVCSTCGGPHRALICDCPE